MQSYEAILRARGLGGFSLPLEEVRGGDDPYAERMQAALNQISKPDYPAGMVPWLREANPQLYRELTERLPDEINRLWAGHAPLIQFESVLTDWLETHRRACALYRAGR